MVCLADPAVRNRARRDIKDMIEKRLTYRKETLLRDEVPPIPNVRRTPKELSVSPVYKRTKSMIPRRINKILVNKSRQVFNETSTSPGSPERTVTINTTYLDSDHDFGYYNRTKRKKSTTIQDLTLQLKETRRLLDVLKEAEEVPVVGEVTRDRPVRRKIEMESGRRRPVPKIADFVSAKELDCESIGSDSELELSPERQSPGRVDKFGVKSSYQDENLSEFEKMERSVSKRRHSRGSTVLNESDPFTDSDYMEVGVNLQEELDISKEYESDAFSMCSEKISHMDARKMLSESEKRFSAILDSLDQEDPDDSFVENERLMQQHSSKLDDILSIPSSVEDLRFDKEELPLLTRSNSDTGSTVTDKKPADIMVPVRQNLQDRPALKFSKQAQSDDQGRVLQPTPIKPIAKKPVPAAKAKENINFKNYESDLNEIENLLFKYDEYRLEQEQKKSEKKTELEEEKLEQPVITKAKTVGTKKVVKDGQTKKTSDGIVSKPKVAPQPKSAVVSASTNSAKSQSGIKTGIAKGTIKTAVKKPLIAPKPASSSKVGTKLPPTKNTLTKSPAKEAAPKRPESSAIAITKGSGLKTDTEKSAVKEKPSPSSGVISSRLSPPKKVAATSKTEEKDSSGQKPTKISPSKIAMKTKTTSPAKVVEKPSSMSSTAPVKKSNTSSLTKGVLKPPSESETKTSSSIPLRASPSKKLIKLTPSSSLGKSKGNYVKSAMMATTKSSANNSNDNIASDKDSSAAANKGLSPLKKTSAITTKTGVKSSPSKETSDSKMSSPKSKLSSVKPSALVKSTIPKPSSSVTIKSTKQSVTPQKPKSIAEEKPHSTPKPAVSMKPAKSDLPSIKPSIASKLAASATSSSKTKPVPKATGLAKPSVNKAATTLTSTHPDNKDVKTSPEKSPSKISPKKQTLIQKTTASAKASESDNTTEAKAPRSKESAAIKTVSEPVSKLAPPKATSTPIKRTEPTAKSNLSPEKSHSNATSNETSAKPTASSTKSSKATSESPSKSSKAASESPSKSSKAASESPSKSSTATSKYPSKSSTATSKYPSKSSTAPSESTSKSSTAPSESTSKSSSAASKSDSKSSTTKNATPSKSTIVSPSKSNTAINKSQTKSTLSSPKPVKKSTGASTTTTAAKKPITTQPAVVSKPEGEPKQESTSLKASDKSPLKVKSPSKTTSKIPSPSKSSAPDPTIKSVNKSETSKPSSGLNPKTDLTKPKVSPKPKVKTLTKTSSTKTIPKPKPVLRF